MASAGPFHRRTLRVIAEGNALNSLRRRPMQVYDNSSDPPDSD